MRNGRDLIFPYCFTIVNAKTAKQTSGYQERIENLVADLPRELCCLSL